ncbi:ABC transporter substrate-binding protein [Gulosibacter chungangensis]|uniref:ABC transporter substrate-binding protein n=1 Tax=Gulosibacter chungangensis TaxID=979746 RepID=A0A7J5BC08_9MICO|nr:ABC transporter substrate-binding protein [Gulosibacter chungangensis]KAB1643646.1 ABC transporter substrate-binding protein [Gulosibacter chungangensis]
METPPVKQRALWRRAAAAAVSLAAIIGLTAGCATSPATSADGSGEPKKGGDLIFQIDSLGDTWIPNSSSISSFQGNVWGELTDKLVYVDPEGTVSPWIAESWEESEDQTQFTLHLKDGVTFSDGTALDAAAVVANLDHWAYGAPDQGIARIGLFPSVNYEGAQAIDPLTVQVNFSEPTLGFIPTLGYHGSILISPDSLALPAEEQSDLYNSIGSGPFVVDSWQDGDHVTITKREDYTWGPEARGHTGPAYLDSITYKVVPETSLRTGSIQSNQADVAYNILPQELDGLKDAGYQVDVPEYLGFTHGLALDVNIAPFDEVKVRQAFQHGINRDEILSTVYTEDWTAASSFIQNVPEATDHSDALTYDPDLAASLLDEAGWVVGADGLRTKDGQTLAVTLYATPYIATSKEVDELLAQQLGAIGFDVTLQVYDLPTYMERVNGSDQIAASNITRSFIDAGTVTGVIVGAKDGDEDWFGVGTSDETLNTYAADIAASSDVDSRAQLLDELQGYVLDQAYFIPITQIVQRIYVSTPDLHGVTYNGLALASYSTAWLDR